MSEGRIPSASEERSTEDIQLCFHTMEFIEKVKGSERLTSFDGLKSLVYNLCAFQYRFSQPMMLPFGLGTDFPEELPRPRPVSLLADLQLLKPVSADSNARDTMVHNGVTYELDAGEDVERSAFVWLAQLFKFLALFPEEDRARRLAACWYYTASEANYDEDSQEEELNSEDERGVGLAVGLGLESIMGPALADDDGEEDEGDAEFEDDEEEDSEFIPSSSASAASGDELMGEDEEEAEEQEAVFKAPYPPRKTEEELEQIEEQVRGQILGCLEELDAYMPSPSSHMSYFKRMLAKMQSGAMDPRWFPWGIPPIQRIIDRIHVIEAPEKLSKQQDETSDFLREILQPFAAMQAQQ